jgi:uncharacterized protein (DUF1015 family)
VNLILPETYKNSLRLFKEWQKNNILVKDKDKTIYIYQQTYSQNNQMFQRLGFISLLKLEDLGKGVLPHEKVLEKDLKDRINLISETRANFGIPFLLYDDRQKITDKMLKEEIKDKLPYLEFNHNDVNHKLWKITDKDFIIKLKEEIKNYQCIIADGHHRYTSELKVKEMQKNSKHGLMCFVNSFNDGMIILPTNRIVFDLNNLDMKKILSELKQYFEIEEVKDINKLIAIMENTEVMIDKKINLKNHVFGVHSNIDGKSYILRLKDREILKSLLPEKTDIYRKLDVNILHKIVIEKILGITEDQQKNRQHIDFIKGNKETIEKMKDKKNQMAFFINPPLMREVFLTARAKETMPQKSTYFYPKIYSGLVCYRFED